MFKNSSTLIPLYITETFNFLLTFLELTILLLSSIYNIKLKIKKIIIIFFLIRPHVRIKKKKKTKHSCFKKKKKQQL